MNGSPIKKIKVKAKRSPGYTCKKAQNVIEVPPIKDDVAPGDTVEIVIPGEMGFTVYLPYGEHFNAQIFEAVKNPEWALAEMESTQGGTEGGAEAPGDVWGVQMIRTSKVNNTPTGEFPFCVFCKEFETFAVSASPPKMNLNP